MKKILSMLVLCALLLTTLGVAASAATYFDYGDLDARVTVKKSDLVKIDGVISDGEYEEYTHGYTEWYVGEEASDYFAEAEEMAKTAKWYFSWDGKYLNIAAKWNAGSGSVQMLEGGDYYGDYTFVDTEDFVIADNCLGYGPGMNLVSAEVSPDDEEWMRFYYAISENNATGEKITGTFSGQNGQNLDYKASHDDFEFVYSGDGWVTAEYRVPIIELCEIFKENQPNQMFKASLVLTAGIAGIFEELSNDWVIPYSWGVRLGQYGYASDAGNTEKVWATFRLVDAYVEGGEKDTIVPPTTDTIVPPTTDGKDDTVVPPATDGKDDTVVPPVTDGGETITPPATDGDEETVVPPVTDGEEDKPVAPPTGDIMAVAAVVSAISACGVVIAKKRK